jgi:hypothetical protein
MRTAFGGLVVVSVTSWSLQTCQLVAQKALEQNLRMKPSLKVEPHEGLKRPALRDEDGPHAFKFSHDSCGRAFHGELKFRFTRQQLR